LGLDRSDFANGLWRINQLGCGRLQKGIGKMLCVSAVWLGMGCSPGLRSAPPQFGSYGWQSLQTSFVRNDASACTGRLTFAMGPTAMCYVAADDTLKCAGRVGPVTFGSSFGSAGQTGVDQILLHRDVGPTQAIEVSDICVHKTDGTVYCEGRSLGSSGYWWKWGTFSTY
jgi:hypothetical protein